MKNLLSACALILSLCVLGGCSKKDDEPGSGNSQASGTVKIDGNSFDIKFGCKVEAEEDGTRYTSYTFFDKDITKYIGSSHPDIEYSCIDFYCEENEMMYMFIGTNVNPSKNTGKQYYFDLYDNIDDYDYYDFGKFSLKNGTISASAKSLPLYGYDINTENSIGTSYATFSVEGKPKALTDLINKESENSRGMDITVITDPDQISLLKNFLPKRTIVKK